MAWLNQKLKQRLLGAFVLAALAVIFLPMLLTRPQEPTQVQVNVPDMPNMPAMPEIAIESVAAPEPPAAASVLTAEQSSTDEELSSTKQPDANSNNKQPVAKESERALATEESTAIPAKATEQNSQPTNHSPSPVKRLDTASLPISWSVQLASLKNHDNAEKLRDDLRSKGYNAYIRVEDGMSKVLVGPLIDRNAANNLRIELEAKQRLKGFIARFQPE